MICIESLDLYTVEKTKHLDKLHPKSRNLTLFCVKSSNYIRHASNSISTLSEKYPQCIYLINKLIQNSTIQNITRNLLYKYYNDQEEISIKQYINKFEYYYRKTQYYYNIKSCSSKIDISEIAINYLYIIQKIHKHKHYSLKYLTNYLYL